MNPMLPIDVFIPDGEAHAMPDGRLYLYGSLDRRDVTDYCSNAYRVFSTDDMVSWQDHGVSFTHKDTLYAPDCAYKDGKYYLYYCLPGGGEGSAVSDSPAGPFTDPRPVEGADGLGIDPSVLVDDDGQAYLFWGQFSLMGARLTPDMRSIDPATVTRNILTEETHGFHEGSSIRKRNGLYYLVYADIARGKPTCLSYAVSRSPLGPYEKGGAIVDNTFCDPASWNNHGCIEEYKGQWYVFYHRSSRNGVNNRRACCERIEFDAQGHIKEVAITSQGAEGPLSPFAEVPAYRACRMRGGAYLRTDGESECLTHCEGSDFWPGWAEFKYMDLKNGADAFTVCARGKGMLRIRTEDRTRVFSVAVDSDEFTEQTVACDLAGGVHRVYLVFTAGSMEVRSFKLHPKEGN